MTKEVPLPTNIALSCSNVVKSYRRGRQTTRVLHGVSLEIAQGKIAFLLGPSGSGKTTLLSILGCLLSADSGEVNVLGKPVTGRSRQQLAAIRRNHFGFLFQKFHLIRGLTSKENVTARQTVVGDASKTLESRAESILCEVGLNSFIDADPRQMSVGQCQRVALARALISEPKIIFADEPTASLDTKNGMEMMKLIHRLTREKKMTAIVVTHDHRILQFADEIFSLNDGQLTRSPPQPSVSFSDSEIPITPNALT